MITELSILIPTYNHHCLHLVRELQRQAEALSSLHYEIIVGDDGSTDKEVVETNNAINLYKGCRVMVYGSNRGRSIIRNSLSQEAKYKWLLFLDSDVNINNQALFIKNYVSEASEVPVIYGGIILPDVDHRLAGNLRYRYEKSCIGRFTAEKRTIHPYKSFRTINFLIRKDIMLAHPFNSTIQSYGYEDVLLGKSLCADDVAIKHIDNPVCMQDFEPNDIFLRKTEESCRTLYSLKDSLTDYSSLLSLTENVMRSGLSAIVSALFTTTKNALTNNLCGSNPSVLLYNMYRVGYIVNHARAISEKQNNQN